VLLTGKQFFAILTDSKKIIAARLVCDHKCWVSLRLAKSRRRAIPKRGFTNASFKLDPRAASQLFT
jgi:hypothetical protein